jgi:DNA processing protein
MIQKINFNIKELEDMKRYPDTLYYIGNTNLLNKIKLGIVGSRHPNNYAREKIAEISSKLSASGICIVSGGAMGIDTVAHTHANPNNTIMIAGTGLDKRYPKINYKLIQDIEKDGLVLSQFEAGTPSLPRNFAIRNSIIVALSKALIVGYADRKSGTMRSVEYAIKMGKEIFVLPHRISQSDGTNELLEKGKATAIYDIDEFVNKFASLKSNDDQIDEFLEYCSANPTYDEAVSLHSAKVFEYELLGKIEVKNGQIFLLR